ncbi:hypothetical protein SAMN05421858_3518 [Haladaptatus litoreus]|uniref:Succinylglutamate desuccinylase / Aspartoacylase family protein n=1 Tax=Haladaptatus litoreus TaxID=553468 RepID=A0A1N7DCT6_9EURY|nr:deacylase [Haladaptatus litoreus]SIR73632.1 hypothetical protein SAMN05421858_3518 [Haladaptatus litoreus]
MKSDKSSSRESYSTENDSQTGSISDQSRRSFLTKSAGIAAFSTLGVSQVGKVLGDDGEFCPIRQSHSKDTILKGTKEEVKVHTTESRIPGPTAVVVGGIQGIEPATWKTANAVHDWSIDSGKLVVLPEVNPVAIRNNTYVNENGDLNDQFPPGKTPTTKLARALWQTIEDIDPDVFISLHSSQGILWEREGPSGFGQAIYPTYVDGAREDARRTVKNMNQRFDEYRSLYDFKVGNTLYGVRPLLSHKVAADLQIPGFLIETTRYGTELETRVRWEKAIVANLLKQNGMDTKR